jgi:hypothetical protein
MKFVPRFHHWIDIVLATVQVPTHAPGVPYQDYIDLILTNPIAIEVKLADLEDNMDIRRLDEVNDSAVARFRKYLVAYRLLSSHA